jgi:hypothetical protein
MASDSKPAPSVKPNQPIPTGARVARQEAGRINSANEAGGEVRPSDYERRS